jgi:capsular polysaccharide biosynthesis protein
MARFLPLLSTAGLLLLVALGGCSRTQPGASVVFEFVSSKQVSEQDLRALLPAGDGSIDVHRVQGTNLFEITVADPDPANAVRRANEAADALRSSLHNETQGAQFRVWQRARPSQVPKA